MARRPIPAHAGIGPGRTPRDSRRGIGRYIGFFSGSLPPIFSHWPFGTYFQSSGALAMVAWPAHECLAVAQSFLPASAIPRHFSLGASSAETVALPSASRLPTAEAMAIVFRFMKLL